MTSDLDTRRYLIRQALAQDVLPLLELQKVIYTEGIAFVGDGPPTAETLARRLRLVNAQDSLFLVAVSGRMQQVCAWLELNRLFPRRLKHIAVLTLAVAPAFRRLGLASELLEASFNWSQSVGVEKISLNVRANNKAAIALYEKHAFLIEGRERFHIRLSEGYEDNVIMAKFIGVNL